jgi:hypothetical protein
LFSVSVLTFLFSPLVNELIVALTLHPLTNPKRELFWPGQVDFTDIAKSGEQLARNEKQLPLNGVETTIVWRARRFIE